MELFREDSDPVLEWVILEQALIAALDIGDFTFAKVSTEVIFSVNA